MNLSSLILAVGDDNVQFQNLDQCASDINYSAKKGTKITFGTDCPVNLDGTEKLGLVLWFDREAVAKAMGAISDQDGPSPSAEHDLKPPQSPNTGTV